jgi:hypothetical protein
MARFLMEMRLFLLPQTFRLLSARECRCHA